MDPRNGAEILAPRDKDILGVFFVNRIIFSNDSLIAVGAFGLGVYHNDQWVRNIYSDNLAIYDIIPYHGKCLIAVGF